MNEETRKKNFGRPRPSLGPRALMFRSLANRASLGRPASRHPHVGILAGRSWVDPGLILSPSCVRRPARAGPVRQFRRTAFTIPLRTEVAQINRRRIHDLLAVNCYQETSYVNTLRTHHLPQYREAARLQEGAGKGRASKGGAGGGDIPICAQG